MAHTLSNAEQTELFAVLAYLQGSPEIPFDATAIERVGRIAASAGFSTTGDFSERAKNSPITVLLEFAQYLGAT